MGPNFWWLHGVPAVFLGFSFFIFSFSHRARVSHEISRVRMKWVPRDDATDVVASLEIEGLMLIWGEGEYQESDLIAGWPAVAFVFTSAGER